MRLHNYLWAAALALLCARTTHAAEHMKVGFMADFVSGISIPIADGDYKNYADASFKMGVRLGAVLYVHPKFGVAPEFEFDFIPVNSNDATFQNNGLDAQFYRERALFGARFIVPFSIGSFYARAGLGVDHIGGSVTVNVGPVHASSDYSSTGFTFEPGVGVQFNIVKHLVLGVSSGFPIALHDFGSSSPTRNSKFTAVDIDFLAVVGVRFE